MSMSRLPRRTSSVLQKLRLTWGGLDLQKQKLTENNKKITAAYMFPYSSIWIRRRCWLKSVNLRSYSFSYKLQSNLFQPGPTLYKGQFLADSPCIDSCLSPSTTATSLQRPDLFLSSEVAVVERGSTVFKRAKTGKKTVGEKFGKKSV